MANCRIPTEREVGVEEKEQGRRRPIQSGPRKALQFLLLERARAICSFCHLTLCVLGLLIASSLFCAATIRLIAEFQGRTAVHSRLKLVWIVAAGALWPLVAGNFGGEGWISNLDSNWTNTLDILSILGSIFALVWGLCIMVVYPDALLTELRVKERTSTYDSADFVLDIGKVCFVVMIFLELVLVGLRCWFSDIYGSPARKSVKHGSSRAPAASDDEHLGSFTEDL